MGADQSQLQNSSTDRPAPTLQQIHQLHPDYVHHGHVHHGHVYHRDVHDHSQATDFDKTENDIRESLCEKIQVMTDLQESESLPLQVAKQSKPQREVFGRRGWFDETSNEDNTKFYDMHKLFEQSKMSSKNKANQKFRSQTAKECYVKKNGNVVGVHGVAGIGKTTMVKVIANILNNMQPIKKSPLIFFVSFRDIDFSKPCSVLQFLTSSMVSDWDHTPESDKTLLEIINKADDVHIFTDAMDEARGLNQKDVAPKMSLFDIATPDVIFKNLYSGHLLPKAKKLLTSRPGAFHDLHPDYKPEFSVTVLGLSKESQELLCKQICGNADDAEKLKAMFASNPSISSLCFVPMFCRMTVSYLLQNITSNVSLLSSSDMFTFSLDQCVRSEHFKGDVSNVLKLTKLAFDRFCKNHLTFDVKDLQAAGVDSGILDVLINVEKATNKNTCFKILDGEKRYYFSHVLWHEFFSAVQLIFCSSDDQFRDFYQHFHEYRWYSVVKFLFGLSNPLVLAKMQSMFPQIADQNLSQKRVLLKSFLQTSLQCYCDTAVHTFPSMISYIEVFCFSYVYNYSFTVHETLLMICSWVNELQDDDVSKPIANLLPEQLLVFGTIVLREIPNLFHVLANTETTRTLSVGTWRNFASFDGDGLKCFLQNLHNSPHKLKKLHVKKQVININDFHHFLQDIEELGLKSCNLSLDDVQQIFQALQQRRIPIEHLVLSENPIVSSLIEDCVRALPKIQILELSRCNLSEDFIEKLANAIEVLETPMKYLALSGNAIGRKGIENLSRCIHNVHGLDLDNCKISGNDVEMLANKIAELDEPIKLLELGRNEIGSFGLRSLTRCIHKIRSLSLDNCNITGADVEVLTNKIKDLEQPMMLLDFFANGFGSIGLKHVCRCLHNLQHLLLVSCKLTGEDIRMLANAILQLDHPFTSMESLQIDENKIKDNGAFAISRCLHKINLLTIYGCNLSRVGIKALRSTNARNEQKCEILGLDTQ